MAEFEDQMASAGDALTAMAEGTGAAAADALAAAFGRAGTQIEAVLGQAARSGELDFERMAESILRDLARVAAEAVVALGQGGNGGQAVNLNMNFASGADESSAMQSRGAISATLARLVSSGGRFL
ncbi:MAG: phage tail tape measure C-terminal domain-containing protein [Hyphomonas sp.]|uniref:phage tail tape measure C-terminal domain-containing protein n=1 Tax=Hyphomonas sp. TaxID=87 RepID=UPI0030037A81